VPDERPLVAFRFEVELTVKNPQRFGLTNPLCGAAFSECDGLEMTMETRTVREGGRNTEQIHLPGPVSYGSLRLKRGMTRDLDLYRWFAAASGPRGRGITADGVVTMRDSDGSRQLRFTLTGCLPVKLKAAALSGKDGALAVEEMQLAYRSLAVAEVPA
jgi:phage tail-like protein